MADRPFLNSQKWQEQQWRAFREDCHFDIWEFEKRFIKRMTKLGIPMFASEVWRSKQRQAELLAQGKSKTDDGPHMYGCAIDLVHSVKGWNLNAREWALVGHIGKEIAAQAGIKLVWGGDWEFYDPAHWEVADWRVIRGVFRSYPSIETTTEALRVLSDERSKL